MSRNDRALLRAALAALLAIAATGAVRGADPHRFTVTVDAWSALPRDSGLDYAFVDDGGGLAAGGTLEALQLDREAGSVIRLGWRLQSVPGLSLEVRAWDRDVRATGAVGPLPGQIGALLATPDFAAGQSVVDEAGATSRLQAVCIDAFAVWTQQFDRGASLALSGGARFFRLETESSIAYRVDDFGVLEEEFVNRSSEADGIGPALALEMRFPLGSRVAVGTRVGFSAVLGERSGRLSDTLLTDGAFDLAAVVERPGEKTALFQTDLGLEIDVRVARGWSLRAGYILQHGPDWRVEPRFVDRVSQNTATFETADVTFEGPFLGVRYGF